MLFYTLSSVISTINAMSTCKSSCCLFYINYQIIFKATTSRTYKKVKDTANFEALVYM